MAMCDRLERVFESQLYIALICIAATAQLTASFYHQRDVSLTVHRSITVVAAVVIVGHTMLIVALVACRYR